MVEEVSAAESGFERLRLNTEEERNEALWMELITMLLMCVC